MYSITDLKKDTFIQIGGVPYRVLEYQHTQLGRGGAVVKTKLKNMVDGTVLSKTFKGNEKVEAASLSRVDMQYLYKNGANLVLMDQTTYDQTEVNQSILGDAAQFLAEGTILIALKFSDRIVGVDLPAKVTLKITDTEPGVRGDTAGASLKPATLETGAVIKVPLFVNQGDNVVVDSRTGAYVTRA